jgi:hypothetical protein
MMSRCSSTTGTRTDVWLGWTELELDETDLGLFDGSRAPVRGDHILIEHTSFYECRVFNRSTDLLIIISTRENIGSTCIPSSQF